MLPSNAFSIMFIIDIQSKLFLSRDNTITPNCLCCKNGS